ncbi:GNAT family N-acetyltransferase [Streptomyces sp. CAU 1734]|uniref:GNAT family N-acetyltransferase n=1 Tax=Streptomyces sp. CAU 1734 TaxID=3140360 RepID=UPI0032602F56
MIELRVLGPDDWRVWRELRLAALAEAPYAFGATLAEWQGEGDREQRWRARLGIPGSHNVVAVLADGPAGMASGVPSGTPDTVELISMWVSPAVRGQGVGEALVGEVERWAARGPASSVRLSVMRENGPAVALYERSGFKRTGRHGDPPPAGAGRELVMVKTLSAA